MKVKLIGMTTVLCLISTVAYGQSFAGKWETDQATPEGRGRGGGQAVVLDLKIDASNKVAGTVHEIGNGDPFTITEGSVSGKTITFKTDREINRNTVTITWNGQMNDDDTISVTRVIPGRDGPVAVVRGRGGFAGGVPVDPIRTGNRAPEPAPSPRGGPRGNGGLVFHRSK